MHPKYLKETNMIDMIILLCGIAFAVIFIVVFSAVYIPYVIDKEFDHKEESNNQEERNKK